MAGIGRSISCGSSARSCISRRGTGLWKPRVSNRNSEPSRGAEAPLLHRISYVRMSEHPHVDDARLAAGVDKHLGGEIARRFIGREERHDDVPAAIAGHDRVGARMVKGGRWLRDERRAVLPGATHPDQQVGKLAPHEAIELLEDCCTNVRRNRRHGIHNAMRAPDRQLWRSDSPGATYEVSPSCSMRRYDHVHRVSAPFGRGSVRVPGEAADHRI